MRQAMPFVRYAASRHISLAAIFFVLLCLCATSPVLATASVISKNTAFARETLALINAERQKAGYTLLAEDAKLNAAAKERLAELFRSFGNKRPGGRSLADLLRKYSASFLLVAQSNGRGFETPAKAVASFKKSGHDSIQKDGFQRVGIAIGDDGKGKLYYAVIVAMPTGVDTFSGEHAALKKNILLACNAERRKGWCPPSIMNQTLTRPRPSAPRNWSKNTAAAGRTVPAYSSCSTRMPHRSPAIPKRTAKARRRRVGEKARRAQGIGEAIRQRRDRDQRQKRYPVLVHGRRGAANLPYQTELEVFRKEILRLTNAERTKQGLAAFKSDAALDKVGDARAGEIIRFYSGQHLRPDKRKWSTILGEYGIFWKACGENITHGQKTPEAVIASWMNSPGHKANILNKNYTHLGVGARVTTDGHIYWTQNFAAFSDTAAKQTAPARSQNTPKRTASGVSGRTLASAVQKHLGVKYVWGGTTPKGFDCSGLLYYVCKQYGITLPRTSAQQAKEGKAVAKKNL